MKRIGLSPEVYRKLGEYGHRDESWDTIVLRLIENGDRQAALKDKEGRQTRASENGPSRDGPGKLQMLTDGTPLRHRYQRGAHSGEQIEAEVQNGSIKYGEENLTPSRAAIKADRDVRDENANKTHNGWHWWEYQSEDGEWNRIDSLRAEA